VSWKLRRRDDDANRELKRDEVFVSEVYGGYVGDRERDMSYAQYLMIRRSGLFGRLFALAALLSLLATLGTSLGVPSALRLWLYAATGALFAAMVVALVARWLSRGRRRIEQARQPDAQ
jgi:hypothetical protein